MVVFYEKRVVKYYDSMGYGGIDVMQSVVRYLSDEFLHRKGGALPGPWRLSPGDAFEMPQQTNGSQDYFCFDLWLFVNLIQKKFYFLLQLNH